MKKRFAPETLKQKREAVITDHALVRYFERVLGFDIDAVRQSLLTPDLKAAIALKARKIVIDGHEYHIEDGVVKTII